MARVLFLLALLSLAASTYPAILFAQSYSRMEVGVQGASIKLVDPVDLADEKGGFGARVTYNSSPIMAWDAESNFFPSKSPYYEGFSAPGGQRGGRAFMVVAGPKMGWRRRRVGIFIKARPGIMNFSNVIRVQTGILPNGEPYANLFPGGHITHLVLDLGGTMEINATRRTFFRFDVSEMLLRYSDRVYPIPETSGGVIASGVIGNSLLLSAGVSYRLGQLQGETVSIDRPRKWEVGGQYGLLSLGDAKRLDNLPPFTGFFPVYLGDYPGFGGRLTYNFNRWLAVDSSLTYFYTDPHVEDAHRGGKILQGSFGPKAGIHTRRFGVFAKVRPGFLSYGSVLDDLYPPYPPTRRTHFALELGAVLEYYPSRRTMLRFDLSHTLAFYGPALVLAPQSPQFPAGNFVDPGFHDNGMQFTTGFGWRF